MQSDKYFYDNYSLSLQLTNRGDPISIPDGGGDFTEDILSSTQRCSKISMVGDKHTDGPTFSEDPADWNQADYDFNINFLYDYMVNQKKYMKHEEEKYVRNKVLLANMKTMRQEEYEESLRKTSETKRLTREIEGYEWQIKHQSALGANSKIRFLAEEKLNRDLKEQKKRLLKEKEFQIRKQAEEGILQDVIDEHESAKELLEAEQDRRKRLRQKAQWYNTEIATICQVLGKHENKELKTDDRLSDVAYGKASFVQRNVDNSSAKSVTHFLPEINKGRNNTVTLRPVEENKKFMQDGGDYNLSAQKAIPREHVPRLPTVTNASRYLPHPPTAGATHGHVPHPPAASATHARIPQPPSEKKDGGIKRIFRKMKNVIK